ncbi:MAG: hypothetical protein IJ859_05330, partial [Synergistaceae bacterium]|nr:hypothetical protein [Synergistaceae bacterium]
NKIIDFVLSCKNVDTLLVHCYGGESRSRAVAAFVVKMYGQDNNFYFATGNPNEHIYNTLLKTWNKRKEKN